MKFLNFNRVLVLAPHPDDAEYSTAGIILKHTDTYFDILCLTEGGDYDLTTGKKRTQEVLDSWTITSNTNYKLYFSNEKFLKNKGIDEWVNWIESNFTNQTTYDCILVPSEYDSHFEHVVVSNMASVLARISPYSIIQYKSPSTLDGWNPNLFISLGELYNIKCKMLKEFKSQSHKPYFKKKVIDGFHTNFQCMKKGKDFVESYKIVTLYE